GDIAREPPLIGRAPLIAAIERSYRAALGDGAPTLVTVIGARGAGKTRLAGALAARLGPAAEIVDDAHRASAEALDAIELATMEDARAARWICAIADPLLCERRPRWGDRAGRHVRLALEPLRED